MRATVTAERKDFAAAERSGRDWRSFYALKILQTFKGKAPSALIDATEHNSGGFYLDVGKEYLLFLTPYPHGPGIPKGAMMVNYNCGQSREWSKVSVGDRKKLDDLVRFTLKPGLNAARPARPRAPP